MNTATPMARRYFAIIPAAGQSTRMGTQKLLLPWNESTVMDHVLGAWTASEVMQVVVVIRKDNLALRELCGHWPSVELVIPDEDPEDMKRSVQFGLEHLEKRHAPSESDRWLVAPADLPTMDAMLIDRLIKVSEQTDSIVVPRFGDRRGHPISFPWSLASKAFELGNVQGINALVQTHPVCFLELPAADRPRDIDTPADYSSLCQRARDWRR